MHLIDQKQKKIMEECKLRAKDVGLNFDDETLEYVVSNKDMNEMSPKVMVPTMYDFWVHDVDLLQTEGRYKIQPSNAFETVINTRAAISFYNSDNPDWLNTMIYYHVLAHVDFFQNNTMFKHTWNDDFLGIAKADSNLIESLRKKHTMKLVDYVIEFSRSIDNICHYFPEMSKQDIDEKTELKGVVEYYFNHFLSDQMQSSSYIIKEIERYNELKNQNADLGENIFFSEVKSKYPELETKHQEWKKTSSSNNIDVLEFIKEHSPKLNKEQNKWMKSILSIVRRTSLYFAPQIRTKIANEGWASYWHEKLFMADDRIRSHESDFALLNSKVVSLSRVGLNPYAIGLRLYKHIEELGNKGKMNFNFQKIHDATIRKNYDDKSMNGQKAIFDVRKNFSDFTLINTFVDQEFVNKNNLFTVGQRVNQERQSIEYYVKSRKAEDYKDMLKNTLYHPPHVTVNQQETNDECLCIEHQFEGKQLVKDYISDVLVGLEYLWGGNVELKTTEIFVEKRNPYLTVSADDPPLKKELKRIIYTIKNGKVTKITRKS